MLGRHTRQEGPLGRLVPPNFDHVAKYQLDAKTLFVPRPVIVGVNWYENFDNFEQLSDGSFHVGRGDLGRVRGGHCFCLVPMGKAKLITDAEWIFYNQLSEGACEGFGHSRGLTLQTGKFYDAFWLYDDARREENAFPEGEGSTNHSAVKAMIQWGAHFESGVECARTVWNASTPGTKLTSVKWTKDTQEVLEALGRPNADAVPFVNSWGEPYPKVTWLPTSVLDRLLSEEGEADCDVS